MHFIRKTESASSDKVLQVLRDKNLVGHLSRWKKKQLEATFTARRGQQLLKHMGKTTTTKKTSAGSGVLAAVPLAASTCVSLSLRCSDRAPSGSTIL